MSAQAVLSVIAPALPAAPRGSSGDRDAVGFQGLLDDVLSGEGEVVGDDHAGSGEQPATAGAQVVKTTEPQPLVPPDAGTAPELEVSVGVIAGDPVPPAPPEVPAARSPEPQVLPGPAATREADALTLPDTGIGKSSGPLVLPGADAAKGAEPQVLPGADAAKGAEPQVLPGTDAAKGAQPQVLPGSVAKDPAPQVLPGAAVDKAPEPLVQPGLPPAKGPEPQVLPGTADARDAAPLVLPAAPPAKGTGPQVLPGADTSKPAQPQVLPGAAPDNVSAPPSIEGDGPEVAPGTAPADPARTGAGSAQAAPAQPVAPPLRALAERTSRPLDEASSAAPGQARGDAKSADAAPATVGMTGGQPINKPGPQTAPAAPAPQSDAGASPADEASSNGPPAAQAEAAPAAREHSLSTLSRATVDATAQIAAQILRKLEGRSTRFEIALRPAELGRVDVKLDIDSEGRLAARLAFDNPAAATDLRGRVDELRRQLEAAGFELADDAFEFAERDSGSSAFDRGQDARHGQSRAFAAAARLNDEVDLAQPPQWLASPLSPTGVDMKV